ncbi:hypothetical protein N8T08_002056 [Aspergillus melleus]|uniref:Uncharacterized protein n=1 Tax=Aspergillus melleus TaxID=138277 RepID=A0ACC3AMN8_9EURO|nr:hypothetical protein N8T08_002056 [Aspergillus melleus]
MSYEPPTIVIVQGSFQTPLVYESLRTGLQDAGYPVVHPVLPSCSNVDDADFPTRTLNDDALAVTQAIDELVQQGKRVVAQGREGGVVHLFYFAAFILGVGQSVLGTFGESPNNNITSDGRFTIKNGAEILYNDLPQQDAKLWESRLIPQSYLVQSTPLTRAAYEYIPSTYLITENDQAAKSEYQEMFAGTAKAHIERCTAGHSPMLSQPKMLVKRIAAVADKVVAI